MTDRPISIIGGAGPYEAAAVVAVVSHLLDDEAEERSTRPVRPVPPAWIRVGMPVAFGRYSRPVTPEEGYQLPT